MGTNEVGNNLVTAARVDMKFEVVVIPVSDVDRSKEFYERLGWRLDADFDNGDDHRVREMLLARMECAALSSQLTGQSFWTFSEYGF